MNGPSKVVERNFGKSFAKLFLLNPLRNQGLALYYLIFTHLHALHSVGREPQCVIKA